MSIRTLVEFNHDFIRELEEEPERACEEILAALRDPHSRRLHYSNLFRVKHSRHHSEDCPIEGQV